MVMTVNTAVNKQKMQYGAPTKNIPKKTFTHSNTKKNTQSFARRLFLLLYINKYVIIINYNVLICDLFYKKIQKKS